MCSLMTYKDLIFHIAVITFLGSNDSDYNEGGIAWLHLVLQDLG